MRRKHPVSLGLVLVALVEAREKVAERAGGVAGLRGELRRRPCRRRARRRDRSCSRAPSSYALVRQLLRTARSTAGGVAAHLDHGLALLDRVDGVLADDVADLMSQDAGQLRFVLREAERAARDVDEPARRRERVDAVGIEHDECPVQIRPIGLLRQRRSRPASRTCGSPGPARRRTARGSSR